MATIKSYTDLSQSEKLAEILSFESADMCYAYYHNPISGASYYEEYPIFHMPMNKSKSLPCWSLAALLGVLPKGTNISTPNPLNELSYCCWNHYDEIYADNPVDACYEMIIRLHELNLL